MSYDARLIETIFDSLGIENRLNEAARPRFLHMIEDIVCGDPPVDYGDYYQAELREAIQNAPIPQDTKATLIGRLYGEQRPNPSPSFH